ARSGLYRDRGCRREDRFTFRNVRRGGAESVFWTHRDHQQIKRRQGPGSDSRFLFKSKSSQRARTEGLEEAAVRRRVLSQDRGRVNSAREHCLPDLGLAIVLFVERQLLPSLHFLRAGSFYF